MHPAPCPALHHPYSVRDKDRTKEFHSNLIQIHSLESFDFHYWITKSPNCPWFPLIFFSSYSQLCCENLTWNTLRNFNQGLRITLLSSTHLMYMSGRKGGLISGILFTFGYLKENFTDGFNKCQKYVKISVHSWYPLKYKYSPYFKILKSTSYRDRKSVV